MEDIVKQRLAELEARAPVKRRKQQPFVKVPLKEAARAAENDGLALPDISELAATEGVLCRTQRRHAESGRRPRGQAACTTRS